MIIILIALTITGGWFFGSLIVWSMLTKKGIAKPGDEDLTGLHTLPNRLRWIRTIIKWPVMITMLGLFAVESFFD